jgi:hypothetical protein
MPPAHFTLVIFSDRVSHFLPGWLWATILLFAASCEAGITGYTTMPSPNRVNFYKCTVQHPLYVGINAIETLEDMSYLGTA